MQRKCVHHHHPPRGAYCRDSSSSSCAIAEGNSHRRINKKQQQPTRAHVETDRHTLTQTSTHAPQTVLVTVCGLCVCVCVCFAHRIEKSFTLCARRRGAQRAHIGAHEHTHTHTNTIHHSTRTRMRGAAERTDTHRTTRIQTAKRWFFEYVSRRHTCAPAFVSPGRVGLVYRFCVVPGAHARRQHQMGARVFMPRERGAPPPTYQTGKGVVIAP